jgi:hypothetical protein
MVPPRGKESAESEGRDARPESTSDGSGALAALPELMRKALTLSLSSFFVTEEAVRKALAGTLPQEWIDFAAEQSSRTRAEFVERLSVEVGRTLESADLASVLAQLLEGRTLEVKAEIRLQPQAEGANQPRPTPSRAGDKA